MIEGRYDSGDLLRGSEKGDILLAVRRRRRKKDGMCKQDRASVHLESKVFCFEGGLQKKLVG